MTSKTKDAGCWRRWGSRWKSVPLALPVLLAISVCRKFRTGRASGTPWSVAVQQTAIATLLIRRTCHGGGLRILKCANDVADAGGAFRVEQVAQFAGQSRCETG
jgi:hypothetical protein